MYCKHCGSKIDDDCVVCPNCGKQVAVIQQEATPQPTVVVNNSNQNINTNTIVSGYGRPKNKWVAFLLCLFLGGIGAHKFYEGKVGMGILYLFALGLFGIRWIVDIILILLKPNPFFSQAANFPPLQLSLPQM